MGSPRVAVLVPCYNEAITIERVVADFRKALPEAVVYVFDNDSEDDTAERAQAAGARVGHVRLRGKGHVVRRLFADIDADIYVLVDGDDTYSAACAPRLIGRLREGHDMVVGVREATGVLAYRAGHAFGNSLLTGFLGWLFGRPCRDILSGYRAFSRRFVKSFPAQSGGFEIETELTVHALELHMSIGEVPTPYKERPEGSVSKLSTWRDGFRIVRTMLKLFSTERPIAFYGALSLSTALLGFLLGLPLLLTYLETGLVPRIPTAILVTALAVVSMLAMVAGLVLDAVARGRRELRALAYLRWPSPAEKRSDIGN
ncbi:MULTISPECIES: glycosyltransferase [unclassified Pseudoxanthomonas]|uniref:glycosyltransferase n=1 Tax=unclassified Pseudoxanthomonas TaxID=2645906 RepID=UPI00162095D9|nr:MULTISPECIES: glycosyltransferase [unclassified Pseudoxanthomonas]MBB3275253.1 glycosyltransferase involved in cell wall biosynthesis [Pseudoxanthomonas sp. OG2]MBD9378980.1 glycosyltransferase [Pseudoxanthomonas sp. PXM04]MBV7473656.1 glycosyltransferase [Pseudoxanthomonas sp. PXM05]